MSGPWPAAYKEAVVVGLKLAPPKASPIKLKMKTRTKTIEVVIKTEGQTRVSTPRAVAISAVIAPMVDETNTHMNVSIASPIAAFIAPISFTSTHTHALPNLCFVLFAVAKQNRLAADTTKAPKHFLALSFFFLSYPYLIFLYTNTTSDLPNSFAK